LTLWVVSGVVFGMAVVACWMLLLLRDYKIDRRRL
jgi:hypothetical protein